MVVGMTKEVSQAKTYINTPHYVPYKYTVLFQGIVVIINLLLYINKRLNKFEEVIKEEWDQ